MSDVIEIRPYRPIQDKSFVFATWLRNYKNTSYFAKRIRHAVFFGGHHKVIEHLLAKPGVVTLIACAKEDHDTIMGYLCFERRESHLNPVVHYVFTKEIYQRMGVARALFKAAEITVPAVTLSHWTYVVDEFIRRWPDMVYDPYAL